MVTPANYSSKQIILKFKSGKIDIYGDPDTFNVFPADEFDYLLYLRYMRDFFNFDFLTRFKNSPYLDL